jgi:hypothetical protein
MVAWKMTELRVRLNWSKVILEGDSLKIVNAFHIQKIIVDTSKDLILKGVSREENGK